MYNSKEKMREYFKKRYADNKERFKIAQANYWVKYAKQQLNKEDVTEEEVKKCKNNYYQHYRDTHKDETNRYARNCYNRKVRRNKIDGLSRDDDEQSKTETTSI